MNPILRNVLAVVVGWFGGSVINMGLIQVGHSMYPLEGVDLNNMEQLAEAMSTAAPVHFLFPFLAHALGTLVGAALAGLIAATHKMKFSLAIGGLFFIGGVMVNYMIPGPLWFTSLDIIVAYLPMAYLGGRLVIKQ
ncbi:MAG: hypothetical protein ACPGEG_07400 [Salibacteraceae bacterium]